MEVQNAQTQMVNAGIDAVSMANNHAEDLHMAGWRPLKNLPRWPILSTLESIQWGIRLPQSRFHQETPLSSLWCRHPQKLGRIWKRPMDPFGLSKLQMAQKRTPTTRQQSTSQLSGRHHLGEPALGRGICDLRAESHQTLARTVIDSGANGVLAYSIPMYFNRSRSTTGHPSLQHGQSGI